MNIYLLNNERYDGPYSEPEVMARIKDGRFTKTSLAWCEGFADAVPLIDILCQPPAAEAKTTKPTLAKPVQTTEGYSATNLRLIADNYRTLLVIAIIWLVGMFIPMSDLVARIMDLVLLGFWFRSGWMLSKGLHKQPWVWLIWSLIPLGNLYALVRILGTAARTLKANGVPVKFLMPDQIALARLALLEKPEAQA